MRRRHLLAALPLGLRRAAEPWQVLPPTPAPVPGAVRGMAGISGIRLYHAQVGAGPPVVLLHGGLANSDYWGHQVRALAPHRRVILIDSRGQGRSTRDARPFSYDLMADDVAALLDVLGVARADIVGWSDGAIIAIDLALRHAARVGRIVAFAGNTDVSGIRPGASTRPAFAAYLRRAAADYRRLSPTPSDYDGLAAALGRMWAQQPRWSAAALRGITAPVLVMDGDHDEAIRRAHTEHIAATIPGARLAILPNTSHFAFLQDPDAFNAAMLGFLGA